MAGILEGKTVIVTGAGAGIGWGITNACVDAGATVIMAELNPAYESRAKALRDKGANVFFNIVDVGNPESIGSFTADIERRFERIDGLVNNAGITLVDDFLSFSLEQLDALWSTNLRSVFLMCQSIARIMKAQGSGAIVNISSNHAIASVPGYEMYAATKGGITSMTKAMCWSLGRQGIRVNSLCPGLTRTEAIAEMEDKTPGLSETFNHMHATGSYSSVKQIGDVAVFLLSDLSQAITGEALVADHGLTASLCNSQDLNV